jgi:hypothetical protein
VYLPIRGFSLGEKESESDQTVIPLQGTASGRLQSSDIGPVAIPAPHRESAGENGINIGRPAWDS